MIADMVKEGKKNLSEFLERLPWFRVLLGVGEDWFYSTGFGLGGRRVYVCVCAPREKARKGRGERYG